MEEDAKEILSPLLTRPQIQKQFDALEMSVKEAKKRIDMTAASDESIVKAIRVVERFLRRKRRVCYGGQAINAQLPRGRQFYDEKTTLPDYDFFSPSVREDVEELIRDLEAEGFKDVSKKVGMHEGTMKVLVNFVPVADCSEMHPELFATTQRRARAVNGIYYCDPQFLLMLMYLELSRPRGEVDRWKKVYERLTLLRATFPPGHCDAQIKTASSVSAEERKVILEFCQLHKRVLVGPEVIELFEKDKSATHMETLIGRGGPVLFMSDKMKIDAEDIRDILNNTLRESGERRASLKIVPLPAAADQLFNALAVYRRGQPLVLIFEEDNCHSYTNLRLEKGNDMRLGSPDLMLHLYYTLHLFGKKEKAFFQTSLECLIQKLHAIEDKARAHPSPFLPAFPVRCSGRQRGIATLLREKQARTEKEKKVLKASTKKVSKGRGGKTRRSRR